MIKQLFILFAILIATANCKKETSQSNPILGEWTFSGSYNETTYDNADKKIDEAIRNHGGAKFIFNLDNSLIIKDIVFDKETVVNGHYKLGYLHAYQFLGDSKELKTTLINYKLTDNKLEFDGESYDFKWISNTQIVLTKSFMDEDENDKPVKFVQIFTFNKN